MGGLVGRIKHLSEIPEYTINDIKNILNKIATKEILIKEKLDGINICFTIRDGKCYFARNKTDEAKGGLSIQDHVERYKNHPAFMPFVQGAYAISKRFLASKSLSQSIEDTLRNSDNQYLNAEIICKDHTNIIKYRHNAISIHNLEILDSKDSRRLERMSTHYDWNHNFYFLVMNSSKPLDVSFESYQRFLGTLDMLDDLGYDNNITIGEIIEQDLKTRIDVEDIKPFSDYVLYGEGKARSLLKACKEFSFASSKEKARKYKVSVVKEIHEAIQNISKALINSIDPLFSEPVSHQPHNIDCEGLVFIHNDNVIKLTGKFQDINQNHSVAR